MHFVTDNLVIWAVLSVVSMLYIGYNQVRRMRQMWQGQVDQMTNGLYALVFATIIHIASDVLLLIAIIIMCIISSACIITIIVTDTSGSIIMRSDE